MPLISQNYIRIPSDYTNIMIPDVRDSRNIELPFMLPANNYVRALTAFDEEQIGATYWDLQAQSSAPSNRFYVYDDGRMAAVWTMGMGTDDNYLDRGTGYNYFDGTSWNTVPTERIETERTGWPTYAPSGNGEIIAAHHNSIGLVINRRDTVGQGQWMQSILNGPDSALDISWPRMVSSGDNHMNIHLLAGTYQPYENLNQAILYYRSNDGGDTWETQHRILEGMTSGEYVAFGAESYTWAEPMNNNLAFVVADKWHDMFIMKSMDNGDTWEKIMVWQHPYPMWNNEPTDTFYSPDGATSLAFDNDGKLHLAFGISRSIQVEGSPNQGWFPYIDGIGYWNEDMTTWDDGSVEALNPDSLDTAGNLIGWMQDLDDNGQIDLIGSDFQSLGLYYVGLSSMPQLTIDEENRIFLVYSGVAEGYDNGTQMYRHLFARTSLDGGETWGEVLDLTGEDTQANNESVYPTIASRTDDLIHIIYQLDTEPGLSTLGDFDDPGENMIVYLPVPKSFLVKAQQMPYSGFSLSQNYPNPFSGSTRFDITLERGAAISLRIFDITGRLVMQLPEVRYSAGSHTLPVNVPQLTKGVYTYSFLVDGKSVSNKMIVK